MGKVFLWQDLSSLELLTGCLGGLVEQLGSQLSSRDWEAVFGVILRARLGQFSIIVSPPPSINHVALRRRPQEGGGRLEQADG